MKYILSTAFIFSLTLTSVLLYAQENTPEQQDALHTSAITAFEAVKAGDVSQIPALAEMLSDPRLNTTARTTLENLPNRAGLETLRKGLGVSDDRCVAGIAASLGNMRDTESVGRLIDLASCDCHAEIIRIAALKSLGKIASEDAVAALRGLLYDSNLTVQRTAADGLFTAAREIAAVNKTQAAAWFRMVREAKIDGVTTRIAVQNELILAGNAENKENTEIFLSLLKSSDPADVRSAQIIMAKNPSDALLAAALEAFPELGASSRRALLATLGVSGNPRIVPALITLYGTSENEYHPEIITALGELRDVRALDVFLRAMTENPDAASPLNGAALQALCNLESTAIFPSVRQMLTGDSVKTRLAGLAIVETARLTDLQKEVKLLMMDDADAEVVNTAMRVYSRILVPTPGDIAEFTTYFIHKANISPESFENALANLCKKTTDKKETIDFLGKTYADAPLLLVKYVGMVGGPDASRLLGEYAVKYARESFSDSVQASSSESVQNSDAVVDAATQLLGKWGTVDAAPVLARLAVTLPSEKYRTRTLNGYIRILRQLGMTPLEKRQMLNNALALSEGKPAARERFADIADRFSREFPETQLFNGKDFTGWERVADVFRIEEGAIVAGNPETGVDKNQFLTTQQTYGDFYLRMECKIVDAPKNEKRDGNAGVQFRSVRIPNNHEMIGYQADMTSDGGYWGCLYDESRRRRMLQQPDAELVKSIWRPNEWNRYEILAQGPNVRIFLNGVETVNYTETEENIPLTGLIGLQIHAGGPAQSYYRNIFISTAATNDSRW